MGPYQHKIVHDKNFVAFSNPDRRDECNTPYQYKIYQNYFSDSESLESRLSIISRWSSELQVVFGDSDIGDIVMLVTLWWWLIRDVGGRIIMLATFFLLCWRFSQCIKSVTNVLNRSPTSQTCHQHKLSPTSGTNIDVAKLAIFRLGA